MRGGHACRSPRRAQALYLDFDGYFATVEEQAAPTLHGRPVAVLPYPEARTCVISANAAAKRHGVGTGTGVDEARWRCPGVAQFELFHERYGDLRQSVSRYGACLPG